MEIKEYNPNEPITAGVYRNMPIETYHSFDEWVSWSMLKHIWDSPAHYKWNLDNKKVDDSYNPILDFGNAYEHVLDNDLDKIASFDESERPEKDKTFGSKLNKAWKSNFIKENKDNGKYVIGTDPAHGVDELGRMASSFRQHSVANDILNMYETQISIFWICPTTGLKLRTRPDFFSAPFLADLKTSRISSPSGILREINNQKYNFSLAMQVKGMVDSGMCLIDDVVAQWIFSAKIAPFNTEVINLPQDQLLMSLEGLENKLLDLKRCKDSNEYLSYNKNIDKGVLDYKMPTWYAIENGIQKIGDESKF